MVDIIASRAAAFRLTWIIAALMVPILFLGYYMVSTLWLDASNAQKEAQGAALIRLIIPVYTNAAGDINLTKDTEQLLENGPALAKEIGVSAGFENLAEILRAPSPYQGAVLANSRELINLVAGHSGIIFDKEPETFHLAMAIGSDLPELIADFRQLKMSAKRAAAKTTLDTDGLAQLLLDAGKLSELSDHAASDIKAAGTATAQESAYQKMADLSAEMKFRVASFAAEIRKSFMHPEGMALSTFFEATHMSEPMLNQYKSLWGKATERFSDLISLRQSNLSKKMNYMILASLASILIGLGLAIAMFQSTLKRLDDVELAKKDADLARDEAEDMAQRFSGMNDDMVRVNSELAGNMQMLKDAQDALVKKGRMEQMGQLTATIAHELRNPLGAVRTSAFLIERKIKDKGMGVESQLLRINNGITRCDNIITQLLDFSRTKQLSARSADLDQWLAKTIEEEAKQLPSAVAIDCLLGLDGHEVPFDPSRLQRAVINLVSNASEAMVGNGEDPSRFAVAEPRILISTKIKNGFAVITVKDNGPGISEENLVKIREPLFTTKSFGTGLGLPAVEQIASQHGGTLEITSELGKGAAFTIRLPLNAIDEEAA
jgi:signal transduction histidine kinase